MFELEGMAVEGGSWKLMPFAAGWPPVVLHQIQDYESLGIVVGSLKNQEVDLEPVFVMYSFHAKRGLDMEWWVELSQKVVESELGECPGSVVVGE